VTRPAERVTPVRVLIVDDEALARRRLRTLLDDDPRIEIVGEAESGNVAVRQLREIDIDLVLLDIQMPGINGMDLLHRIKLRRPDVGVVMATVINDVEHAVRAIKAGAYNYLLKPLQRNDEI